MSAVTITLNDSNGRRWWGTGGASLKHLPLGRYTHHQDTDLPTELADLVREMRAIAHADQSVRPATVLQWADLVSYFSAAPSSAPPAEVSHCDLHGCLHKAYGSPAFPEGTNPFLQASEARAGQIPSLFGIGDRVEWTSHRGYRYEGTITGAHMHFDALLDDGCHVAANSGAHFKLLERANEATAEPTTTEPVAFVSTGAGGQFIKMLPALRSVPHGDYHLYVAPPTSQQATDPIGWGRADELARLKQNPKFGTLISGEPLPGASVPVFLSAAPAARVVVSDQIPAGLRECPITGRPFFENIEHPRLGIVATYGGPFDSYTIPKLCKPDDDLRSERYDHDAGGWVEGGVPVGYAYDQQQPEAAAPAVVVDEAWSATDSEITEWLARHGLEHAIRGNDARAAFEDARSVHMIAAALKGDE